LRRIDTARYVSPTPMPPIKNEKRRTARFKEVREYPAAMTETPQIIVPLVATFKAPLSLIIDVLIRTPRDNPAQATANGERLH
jgi:hypothetical protein